MITINATVVNKKGQRGTITRIITKSTGYVEVAYEDGTTKKEMAFNLTDEAGKPLKKAPKRKEEQPVSELDKAMSLMKWVNKLQKGDRVSQGYQIVEKMLYGIEAKANEVGDRFIADVVKSVLRYMSCSDKQAYCLASFAIKNNVTL